MAEAAAPVLVAFGNPLLDITVAASPALMASLGLQPGQHASALVSIARTHHCWQWHRRVVLVRCAPCGSAVAVRPVAPR